MATKMETQAQIKERYKDRVKMSARFYRKQKESEQKHGVNIFSQGYLEEGNKNYNIALELGRILKIPDYKAHTDCKKALENELAEAQENRAIEEMEAGITEAETDYTREVSE